MNDVVDVGVVMDVDADLAVFAQTQDRTGNRAVVAEGLDHLAGSELELQRRNAQRIVRCRDDLRIGLVDRRAARHPGDAGSDQETAAIQP